MEYSWKKPQTSSGVRLVFDSDFIYRGKRMRKLEATTERVEMPKKMAKTFRIETKLKKGDWQTVYTSGENIKRLVKVDFPEPVKADAVRLVVTSTWGGGDAHVFAFDVK